MSHSRRGDESDEAGHTSGRVRWTAGILGGVFYRRRPYRVALNRAKDYCRSLARAARLVERPGNTMAGDQAFPRGLYKWVPKAK